MHPTTVDQYQSPHSSPRLSHRHEPHVNPVMTAKIPPTFLRRYTDLPALLHILATRQLTLIDPGSWDDKNDSRFMALYKDRMKLKSVLALCFTTSIETYHHWRVFSHGPAGACILFNRDPIANALNAVNATLKPVQYVTLKKLQDGPALSVSDLPFVKRYAYKHELEVRALYESKKKLLSKSVPIELDCIRSISLSPWMHQSLRNSTVAAIKKINGCSHLKISRSTLISNDQWQAFGEGAVDG